MFRDVFYTSLTYSFPDYKMTPKRHSAEAGTLVKSIVVALLTKPIPDKEIIDAT